MRSSIVFVAMLVGGCKQVFDLEGYVPSDQPPPEEPFSDRVIGTTRAGTIVAATRDGVVGFPDATIEYRLYLRAYRFTEGMLETDDWERAISYDSSTNTYRFDLITEHCLVDDTGVRCDPSHFR